MPSQMPRDRWPESSLALLLEGYDFAAKRFARMHTDAFRARLLLQDSIVITGREAARLFYDGERFQRAGAMPEPLLATLFGHGGVHGLDGEPHHFRKAMFMRFLTEEAGDRQREEMSRELKNRIPTWEREGRVVLFEEAKTAIFRATSRWAGVPFEESEVVGRTRDLAATVFDAGSPGWKHLQARRARGRTERWAQDLVTRVRDGRLEAKPDSALAIVALYPDTDGNLLSPEIAAVELLNVIRPSVAVASFVTFVALALVSHPRTREQLLSGEIEPRWFVEEVRRHYPFVPALPALVKRDFEWHGFTFPEGTRVFLDVHGINRDPREWDAPYEFRPERFAGDIDDRYTFIPQGGGEAATGHRCPGEWNVIAILEAFLEFLLRDVEYEVPPQDLRVRRSTFPARPNSGFVIANLRARVRED